MSHHRNRNACIAALIAATALTGCGREEVKYEPKPAVSGVKADLPPVPNVPQKPIKSGDAYTVWGASYYLRNRVHRKEVADQKISITGHIIKTNLMDAPECAVHKGGKADPEGCVAPVPTFWIADTADAAVEDSIKVMGWASNFAQIYDAIAEFDKGKEDTEVMDSVWGVTLPNPLPAVGAKVTVEGTYATSFTMSSGGAEADPLMGILTYSSLKYNEPAPELATLPGVKRKGQK
jgi:hypothetical protein